MVSLILRSLLSDEAWQRLEARYEHYCQHGVSRFAAILGCLYSSCAWLFLTLESPAWQSIISNQRQWFPHIDPDRPRPLDLLRYLIQGLWLVLIKRPVVKSDMVDRRHRLSDWFKKAVVRCQHLSQKIETHDYGRSQRLQGIASKRFQKVSQRGRRVILVLMSFVAIIISLLCISQPFSLRSQFVFVVLLWAITMIVRKIPGRLPLIISIVLSLIISCRYIWWRYTATLNWDDGMSLFFGLLLLMAETYAWLVLVLGYFQAIWPLNRPVVELPKDLTEWPTVDIMIPTYNEDLAVVKPTVYAALGMDWPKDKLNIYLLDDGGRDDFKAFAAECGIHYQRRATHEHAKAGNINHALQFAKGEYVAIFDCDHVPTRSFLQLTMGWFFKDSKLAVVQTPHHFFSPDPFERNLGRFRQTPNEGTLFYGLVQDGNDLWDATFFCGSCAIIKRQPLDEVGGVAVETVTEDAHTSLRLHRKGYTSAYIRIPLAAGLATESLSAHIGQRIRWARGMTQILRLDNPLFGKGLNIAQRLCYFNAMLNFLSGIPRLIFLVAPLAFLYFHAYIIYAPAIAIVLYVVPHMLHASLTNSKIQGKYRHSFWSEVYESVLAWYIAYPTLMALINPHKGTFNVTVKGGLVTERYLDWRISLPYFILVILNLGGLLMGLYLLVYGNVLEIPTVLISLAWVLYNLVILGAAVAVAMESRQIRHTHRVEMSAKGALLTTTGYLHACQLHDYSNEGVGLELPQSGLLQVGDKIQLLLKKEEDEHAFSATVVRSIGTSVGVHLNPLSLQERINFIQCTFAKPDTWAKWQKSLPQDKPLRSMADVIYLGFVGYQRMAEYAPPVFRQLLRLAIYSIQWVGSFVPRTPKTPPLTS